MAWTTPATFTAGSVLTAAQLNVNVRDNTADLRSYQNRFAVYRYSGGNINLAGTTTWSNLTTIGTAGDLTLNASTGDVIEAVPFFVTSGAAVELSFDWVTVVGGVVTNSFSLNGAAPAGWANLSLTGYYCPSGALMPVTGPLVYTLAAGDISSGTVTVRLRYAMSAATARAVYASASGGPLMLWVKNLGPVTT